MPPRTDLHWNLALVYAGLEEKDKAFAHLTNAYKVDERSPAVLKVEPLIDNLRARGRHFEVVVIVLSSDGICVMRSASGNCKEMMAERKLSVDHVAI